MTGSSLVPKAPGIGHMQRGQFVSHEGLAAGWAMSFGPNGRKACEGFLAPYLCISIDLGSSLKTRTGILETEIQLIQLGISWRWKGMGLESQCLSWIFASTSDPLSGLGRASCPNQFLQSAKNTVATGTVTTLTLMELPFHGKIVMMNR